jgi:uncharacterized membrane protein YeaQ/YmgE (transglycosylase-associated protein family)
LIALPQNTSGYTKETWAALEKSVSIEEFHIGALGKCINLYIWCATGAVAGWLLTCMMKSPARSAQIENILIGTFGAFIGGEFLSVQLSGPAVAQGFHITSLLLAIAGAVLLLLLLQLMRKVVGPLRQGKSSQKKRDY